MLSPILTLFACISKPLWLNIHSTGAEVAGGQFHASWVTKTESSWSQVPRPRPRLEGSKTKTKTKTLRFQDQDQDRDSRVPRPRPRLWGSKTKTETKTCKNGSRDQNSSLENSKSGVWQLRLAGVVVASLPDPEHDHCSLIEDPLLDLQQVQHEKQWLADGRCQCFKTRFWFCCYCPSGKLRENLCVLCEWMLNVP